MNDKKSAFSKSAFIQLLRVKFRFENLKSAFKSSQLFPGAAIRLTYTNLPLHVFSVQTSIVISMITHANTLHYISSDYFSNLYSLTHLYMHSCAERNVSDVLSILCFYLFFSGSASPFSCPLTQIVMLNTFRRCETDP